MTLANINTEHTHTLTIFTEPFCLALRFSSKDTKALVTWASSAP